jgi:hypothetical protein
VKWLKVKVLSSSSSTTKLKKRRRINPNPSQILPKTREEGTLPVSRSPLQSQTKTSLENSRTISLLNTHAKVNKKTAKGIQ